tara:strand:- start:8006 stop:8263 length:258 start_codon:yes stop_codon:yes gene_type:complete
MAHHSRFWAVFTDKGYGIGSVKPGHVMVDDRKVKPYGLQLLHQLIGQSPRQRNKPCCYKGHLDRFAHDLLIINEENPHISTVVTH